LIKICPIRGFFALFLAIFNQNSSFFKLSILKNARNNDGSTGMVGKSVLIECLEHENIKKTLT